MLTKAQIKYIRSLTQQKFRYENNAFIAEGAKIAAEWLASARPVKMIVATEAWVALNTSILSRHSEAELFIVEQHVLDSMSGLQTPGEVLLVIPIAERSSLVKREQWYLALDGIQDPGNMGTIIRIADWFGVADVLCSPGCADALNPKVVQSAMGSHLRVSVHECDLATTLPSLHLPIYAATLGGKNVHEMTRGKAGVLVIGNESKGISERVLSIATHTVTIPRRGGAESLNAAVSAGILCAVLLPC